MKDLFLGIRDKFVGIWTKIVNFFHSFIAFWKAFPRNFVNFWKEFWIGTKVFFKNLPSTLKSKDKTIDLLIGIGACIVWSMPVIVVVYVLTWFLTK